jgi:hypothetical protein
VYLYLLETKRPFERLRAGFCKDPENAVAAVIVSNDPWSL